MADEQNKGYALPIPGAAEPNKEGAGAAITQQEVPVPPSAEGPQTRDLIIGGGVLLVLMIALFFAKNAYANWLVGRRVSPRSANASGWWLFVCLSSLAAAGIFPMINSAHFLTWVFMVPLGGIALLSLVLMILSGRR